MKRAGDGLDRKWTGQVADKTGTNKAGDRTGRWLSGAFLCGLLMCLQYCPVVWRRPGSWCRGVRILEGMSSEITWPFTSIFSKPLCMCQPVIPRGQGPGVLSLTGRFLLMSLEMFREWGTGFASLYLTATLGPGLCSRHFSEVHWGTTLFSWTWT